MTTLGAIARAAVSDEAFAPRTAVLLRGLVLLLCLAPLAASYSASLPAWDELFFLHNAACVNNAVFAVSLKDIDGCLAAMAKSPIMAALLLPVGPLGGSVSKLASAPVVLALLTFGQIILLAILTQRTRVPLLPVAIAAFAVFLTPVLRVAHAPFLVDNLLSITILNTFFLLLWECGQPTRSAGQAFSRGALWGLIGSIGVLSKLTYLLFAALVFVPIIIVSLRRSGASQTAIKIAATFVFGSIGLLALLRYGPGYYAHAAASAFGELAQYYSDGLTRFVFLRQAAASVFAIWVAVLILGGWVVWRRETSRERIVLSLYLLGLLCLYTFLSSGSQNRDPRFFWPVWVALPFCAAVLVPPLRTASATVGGTATAVFILLALALSFPALGRFDFSAVAQAGRVLDLLPRDRPITVLIGSDEGHFNVETLTLAKQLGGAVHANKTIGTVVYDIIHKRTVNDSIETLRKADYVIMRVPRVSMEPEWANRFHQQFLEALEQTNVVFTTLEGHPRTIVFAKRPQ